MEFSDISVPVFFQFHFFDFLIAVSICLINWDNCNPKKAVFRIPIIELRFPMAIHPNYQPPTMETPCSNSPFLLSETYNQSIHHLEIQRDTVEMFPPEIFPFPFALFFDFHKRDRNRFAAVVPKQHLSSRSVCPDNCRCLSWIPYHLCQIPRLVKSALTPHT